MTIRLKLLQLGDIVKHEAGTAKAQCVDDLARFFDRVGMDDGAWRDLCATQQGQFTTAGDVEAGALRDQGIDHVLIRQGLDRIVQADSGQGLGQRPVLAAHALPVEYQQR